MLLLLLFAPATVVVIVCAAYIVTMAVGVEFGAVSYGIVVVAPVAVTFIDVVAGGAAAADFSPIVVDADFAFVRVDANVVVKFAIAVATSDNSRILYRGCCCY